jgi:hypothetical protein
LRLATWQADAHYSLLGISMSLVILTPVEDLGHWRVKLAWARKTPHFFGKFETKEEAEQWIAEHHWMTKQRQEPGAAEADDLDDVSPDTP